VDFLKNFLANTPVHLLKKNLKISWVLNPGISFVQNGLTHRSVREGADEKMSGSNTWAMPY
jgi:hypothetical protein